MTTENRDWLAKHIRERWAKEDPRWRFRIALSDDLNVIARLWKELLPGWCWGKFGSRHWYAVGEKIAVTVPDTGDEPADRLALIVKAVKAKENL